MIYYVYMTQVLEGARKHVPIGIDDKRIQGYLGLPFLTKEEYRGLENAIYVNGVLSCSYEEDKSRAIIFLDLNPRKEDRVPKQIYREEIAREIVKHILSFKPTEVSACTFFGENGARYIDHPEKKQLLKDLKTRKIKIYYGDERKGIFSSEGEYIGEIYKRYILEELRKERIPLFFKKDRLVQKAHSKIKNLMPEVEKYLRYSLKKIKGKAQSKGWVEESAGMFLSLHDIEIKNGVPARLFITQHLRDYINNVYKKEIKPVTYSKLSFDNYLKETRRVSRF